jgi:hypothetical protein
MKYGALNQAERRDQKIHGARPEGRGGCWMRLVVETDGAHPAALEETV